MRNESSETVEVSIAFQGQGLFGGTDARVFEAPPWREGWCHSLGHGINAGEATVSVSGPSVSFPITTTITVSGSPPDDKISVLIDAAGEVHFSVAAPPPQDGPCSGYGQELPTDSP